MHSRFLFENLFLFLIAVCEICFNPLLLVINLTWNVRKLSPPPPSQPLVLVGEHPVTWRAHSDLEALAALPHCLILVGTTGFIRTWSRPEITLLWDDANKVENVIFSRCSAEHFVTFEVLSKYINEQKCNKQIGWLLDLIGRRSALQFFLPI